MHTFPTDTSSKKRNIQLCLPDDTWAIISLFVERETLPAVFYISKKIQQIVIDGILSCSTIYNLFFSYFSGTKYSHISNKAMKIAQQIFIVAKQRRLYIDGIDVSSFVENCSNILKPKFMIELFQHVEPFISNNFPVQWAAENGEVEMVRHLLNNNLVDPSAGNNYAILQATENGHIEVVRLLLSDERVDPSDNENIAIRWASQYGYIEIVRLLLSDERVDPSDRKNCAIRWASANGHIEIVRLLLSDERVDPSDYRNDAIGQASANGHIEIVKLLLSDERVDPSDNENYAVSEASAYRHEEVVRLLLSDERVNPYLRKINSLNI
jgi:ankyrin repeat protein